MADLHTDIDTILAYCLEAIENGEWTVEECLAYYPSQALELAPLLRLAANLSGARRVRPSLTFRQQAHGRLQHRLIATSRPLQTRNPSKALRFRGMNLGRSNVAMRAGIALLVVVLLASVTGGAAYAADGAVPGDTLYGLDRSVEQVQLNLVNSAEETVRLQLGFADERLEEAETLSVNGSTENFDLALKGYDEAISNIATSAEALDESQQAAVATDMEASFSRHETRLQELLQTVPEQARPGIERALEASQHGHQNANRIQNEGTDHPGQGQPDNVSPNSDDNPGNGPPNQDDKPGNGNGRKTATPTPNATDDKPGNGNSKKTATPTPNATDDKPGNGPPDDKDKTKEP